MCRWCSLLVCLWAATACADVPTPEAPWFAIDFAQPWEDSAGSWTATSNAETSCEWTAASARLLFEGYTNTPVAFAPAVAPGQEPAVIETTVLQPEPNRATTASGSLVSKNAHPHRPDSTSGVA